MPEIRTGYLVLSHTETSQMERFVSRIVASSEAAHIVIAHDARTASLPRVDHPRVQVWDHGRASDWGSWGLVEVTLAGLERLRAMVAPGMVAIASGQDYLCRPTARWEAEFLRDGGWVGWADPLAYRLRWGRTRGEGSDDWNRYTYRWFDVPDVISKVPVTAVRDQLARVRRGFFNRVEPILAYPVRERADRRLVGFSRPVTPFREGV